MNKENKPSEGFDGNSALFKAVKLLEENEFFVTHVDTETYMSTDKTKILGYTGCFLIRFLEKETLPKKGLF